MPTYKYPAFAPAAGFAMTIVAGRIASAFAPGHVTGAFRPMSHARDPRGRGSVGAGLVLELGVRATATFHPGGPRRLRVSSELDEPLTISYEVAHRLLGDRRGRLHVTLSHQLPVGQGFGTSAAGAVATALAVAQVLGRPRRRAIEVAHLADLFGGGGLGGVAAILGGGLEVRLRPGIPPFGEITHRTFGGTIWVGVVGGPIPSPQVLGDARVLARIDAAARACLPEDRDLRPSTFFALSERFTDRTRIASPRLRDVLRGLRRRGAWAFQAMFGQSFVARPRSVASAREIAGWLVRSEARAVEIGSSRQGARVLRSPYRARPPPGGTTVPGARA